MLVANDCRLMWSAPQVTKAVVYLDPEEFKTTWCGVIYFSVQPIDAQIRTTAQAGQQGNLPYPNGNGYRRGACRSGSR